MYSGCLIFLIFIEEFSILFNNNVDFHFDVQRISLFGGERLRIGGETGEADERNRYCINQSPIEANNIPVKRKIVQLLQLILKLWDNITLLILEISMK